MKPSVNCSSYDRFAFVDNFKQTCEKQCNDTLGREQGEIEGTTFFFSFFFCFFGNGGNDIVSEVNPA